MAETYSLKAFASTSELADNQPGTQIALIGEIGVSALTYSRDQRYYSTGVTTDPGVSGDQAETTFECDLAVFSSRKTTGEDVEPATGIQALIKMLSLWVYRTGMTGGFGEQAQDARDAYLDNPNLPSTVELIFGPMVSWRGQWYPSSMEVVIDRTPLVTYLQAINSPSATAAGSNDDLLQSRIKLWFSNQSFLDEYDEYEIFHVPALEVVDDFFNPSTQVRSKLIARTPVQMLSQINQATEKTPYTYLAAEYYDYKDATAGNTVPTLWMSYVYGRAGTAPDIIKSSLAAWILSQSEHTRDEWIVKIPDIFLTTEFLVLPTWHQYAIPNMTVQSGIYSPQLDVQDAITIANKAAMAPSLSSGQIIDSATILGNGYKSVSIIVVSGMENREGARRLNQLFPDYIDVNTNSLDFGRMQPATQEWVTLLQQMLMLAETMTRHSTLPKGFSRIIRQKDNDEVMYVARLHQQVQYLVASRESMVALFGLNAPEIDPENVPLSLLPSPDITLRTEQGSKALSVDFEALGGTAPHTFTLLPSTDFAASEIGPSTGQCEITFASFGTFLVRVQVKDALDQVFQGNYTVVAQP